MHLLFGLLLFVFVPTAAAVESAGFGGVRFVSGDIEFEDCLNSSGCAQKFYRFLGEATLEQGFAMESASPATSSLIHRVQGDEGYVAGGMINTFPFSPPRKNLAGKEENTSFSPVFPKLLFGKLWSKDDHFYGLGFTALPPVPVSGASALNLGMDASVAQLMSDDKTRMGLEVDFSFIRAKAPVVASKEQMENAEEEGFDNNVKEETYEERCDPDTGCIDTFTVANLSLRGGMSWQLCETLFPYAKLGLSVVNERLYVQYDNSKWATFALQPTAHLGSGWTPAKSIFLSTGLSVGLQQANQNPSESLGIFYRLEGSAAARF